MYLLAKFYNKAFNNKISIFIYLTILSVILNSILCILTHTMQFGYLLFLIVITLILSLSTQRLSPVVIYSPILKILSMNLIELSMYSDFNYDRDKAYISESFKENFIEGLVYAGNKGYKKVKMTTHKWVVYNVLMDERVKKYYDIKCTKSGLTDITLEALLLACGNTNNHNFKRHQYKIVLTLKK